MDYCVLGVPYDSGVTGRPGCRFGPSRIRAAYGAQRLAYEQDNAYKVRNLVGVDLGNVGLISGYALESMALIGEQMGRILDAGAVPVVLGGDRLLLYPELMAYHAKYRDIALVQFCAHRDSSKSGRLPVRPPDRPPPSHGGRPPGLRPLHPGGGPQRRRGRAPGDGHRPGAAPDGPGIMLPQDPGAGGQRQSPDFFRHSLPGSYLCARGQYTSPGGFSTYEACHLLRGLEGLRLAGFDLVEVSEARDPAGITPMGAVAVLKQFLILLSKQKATDAARKEAL